MFQLKNCWIRKEVTICPPMLSTLKARKSLSSVTCSSLRLRPAVSKPPNSYLPHE